MRSIILYYFETQVKDLYFLGQAFRTSTGSVQGCTEATKECTWFGGRIMY